MIKLMDEYNEEIEKCEQRMDILLVNRERHFNHPDYNDGKMLDSVIDDAGYREYVEKLKK